MEILLFILGITLIVLLFNALDDYFLFRKFKVGYRIDLYKTEHIALETYKKLNSYKILARKDENISVLASNNEIVDLNIYELILTIDMIKIMDKNGYLSDIVYKRRYEQF